MNIGIDLDDCIAKTVEYYCFASQTVLKKKVNKNLLTHHSGKLEEQGLLAAEEFQAVNSWLVKNRFLRELEPYEGVVEAFSNLKKAGHEVYIITSRDNYDQEEVRKDTEEWLNNHKVEYTEVHFGDDKATILKKLKIDYFIDDRFKYVDQAKKVGVKSALFAQPWNTEKENRLVDKRFSSWKEFEDYLINDSNE